MSVMSLKEHLQTRNLPNITNSMESFVSLYFQQRGPRIWAVPRATTASASPKKMVLVGVILKASLDSQRTGNYADRITVTVYEIDDALTRVRCRVRSDDGPLSRPRRREK
jgi:hypothetical protein